jgi:hypothetical protein
MKKNIIPVVKEISEILIDKILDDGLVKDVPIINIIHLMCNAHNSISDNLLLNKIEKFLFKLDSIDSKDRINLFQKLEKEPRLKQKTSIYILELFDKIDDENKVTMIFKIFKAYNNEEIDYETFYRLNKVTKEISSIDISKVRNIKNEFNSKSKNLDLLNSFENINLIRVMSNMDGNIYFRTKICKVFIELNLDEN